MMHLFRSLLLAPFVCAALTACYEDLDPNESASGQVEDPGKLQVRLEVESRWREANEEEGNDEENPAPEFATFAQARLVYDRGDSLRQVLLGEQDRFVASTPSRPAKELRTFTDSNGILRYGNAADDEFEPAVTAETMTVSLERSTPPAPVESWYPQNDSPETDFSDYYVDTDISIEMPPDVSITAPAHNEGLIYTGSNEITVTWSPFGVWTPDNVEKPDDPGTGGTLDESAIDTAHTLFFRTQCGYAENINRGWIDIEGDPGMVTIPLVEFFEIHANPDDELAMLTPIFVDGDCVVDIDLRRHTTGTFDADALDDGSIVYGRLRSESVRFFLCSETADECPRTEDDSEDDS